MKVYIGDYLFDTDKPLYREISKIPGLGLISSLEVLKSYFKKDHSVRLKDFSEKEIALLTKLLNEDMLKLNIGANYKNRYASQITPKGTFTLIGDALKASFLADIKNHKNANTYVGMRHTHEKKVHAQRTQNSGRKNKKKKIFNKN